MGEAAAAVKRVRCPSDYPSPAPVVMKHHGWGLPGAEGTNRARGSAGLVGGGVYLQAGVSHRSSQHFIARAICL